MTTALQTPIFKKSVKKLHKNQKQDLDEAIKALMKVPLSCAPKKGGLAFLRVYKFKMAKRLTLPSYSYENDTVVLELIALGSHENFYRDIKQIL